MGALGHLKNEANPSCQTSVLIVVLTPRRSRLRAIGLACPARGGGGSLMAAEPRLRTGVLAQAGRRSLVADRTPAQGRAPVGMLG